MLGVPSRSPRSLLVALLLFAIVPSTALANVYPTYPTPPTPTATPPPSIGVASFVGTYPGGAPIPLSTQTNGDQVYLNAPKTAVEDANSHGCAAVKVRMALHLPGVLDYDIAVEIGQAWTPLYPIGGGIYESPDWFPACVSQPGAITLQYSSYTSYPFSFTYHEAPLGQFTMIDPSGVAYDQTLYDSAIAHGATPRSARAYAAIGGASVTLQSSSGGAFSDVPADVNLTPSVNPETTPTYGGARGQFAWKVVAGRSYRALVTAPGYASSTSQTAEADPVLTGMYTPLHAVCPGGETPDYSGIAAYPTNGSDYPTYPTWDYPTYPETSTYPVYTGYPDYPGYPLGYPADTTLPFTCHAPTCPEGQVGVVPHCQPVIAPPSSPTPTPTPTPIPSPVDAGQAPLSGTGNSGGAAAPKPVSKPIATLIGVAFGKRIAIDKKHRTVTLTCNAATALRGGTCTVSVSLGKKKSGTRLLKSASKLKRSSKSITLTFTRSAWSKARKKGKITITLTLTDAKGTTQTTVSKTISVR